MSDRRTALRASAAAEPDGPAVSTTMGATRNGRPLPEARPAPPRTADDLREQVGVCQWFHFEDHHAVDRSIGLMHELGAKHLRTGISWADYLRPGGKRWYDWQMGRLRQSGLEVLLSVWHTPPSLAEDGACSGPPRRLHDYADFIDTVITDYGDAFHHLELWNEPNNRCKWNFPERDPWWAKFAEMVGAAAHWAKRRGCHTVLGGMIPADPHWLDLMNWYGVLTHIDVIAVHGFPGMWFPDHPNWDWHRDWHGWADRLAGITAHGGGRPVWVTETGVATWDFALAREAKYELQCWAIDEVCAAPPGRYYLYSLVDLDPERDAIEGFHVDENEYHMGLVKHDGFRKHAFDLLKGRLTR
jgi:CDP-paratose 2-epimerase